jgi:PAS domain S-box-containing protein
MTTKRAVRDASSAVDRPLPPAGDQDRRGGTELQDLRESHERYQRLFDSIQQGFCVIEVYFDEQDEPIDYRFLEINPAFERHTGLRNAVGRTARELVPSLERDWLEAYGRVARTGRSERFAQASPAMGRWFEVEAFPVDDPAERRVGLLFADITERKRAEVSAHERRRTDERLRAIVENIRDYAIYAMDKDGHVTEWTEGAARLKGYSADEILGRHVSIFYSPQECAGGTPQQELAEAARDGRTEREALKVRRNGERFWANEITTAMHGAAGELTGFTRISRDLTAERALERQRRAQLERERQAREDTEAFLGLLSHELRTPVTSIYGTASLIARDPQRADVPDLLRDIQEESDRLVRIIDDLLVLSRLDRGLIQLVPEPILLQRLVRQVMADVARRGPEAKFQLDVPSLLPAAIADATALRQVLYNLLSNAAKYAGPEGPITIEARALDDQLEVCVLDEGPGLGDDPEQLFDLYYRAPHTAVRAPGTGIGLYVTRALMTAMGGSVQGWTRDTGGASFRLRIPLAVDEEATS